MTTLVTSALSDIIQSQDETECLIWASSLVFVHEAEKMFRMFRKRCFNFPGAEIRSVIDNKRSLELLWNNPLVIQLFFILYPTSRVELVSWFLILILIIFQKKKLIIIFKKKTYNIKYFYPSSFSWSMQYAAGTQLWVVACLILWALHCSLCVWVLRLCV